jgi:threonine/homoserine/homoserine lactone efflux protein
MVELETLTAFVFVTGMTSLVPGPSMLFVLSRSVRGGAVSGALALAGLQLGYIMWWLLAGLGLGTIAAAFPTAFQALGITGALYLGWLGVAALRRARRSGTDSAVVDRVDIRGPAPEVASKNRRYSQGAAAPALRDGILIALSNPKALIYIVALLPPFVDASRNVAAQLVVLAVVALVIDVALGSLYIIVGNSLAAAMTRPTTLRWLDLATGATFIALAAVIAAEFIRPSA